MKNKQWNESKEQKKIESKSIWMDRVTFEKKICELG